MTPDHWAQWGHIMKVHGSPWYSGVTPGGLGKRSDGHRHRSVARVFRATCASCATCASHSKGSSKGSASATSGSNHGWRLLQYLERKTQHNFALNTSRLANQTSTDHIRYVQLNRTPHPLQTTKQIVCSGYGIIPWRFSDFRVKFVPLFTGKQTHCVTQRSSFCITTQSTDRNL